MQIATLPTDQQEPARKDWEKVLRPFKRREPWPWQDRADDGAPVGVPKSD